MSMAYHEPNMPTAPNSAIRFLLDFRRSRRRVGEPGRWLHENMKRLLFASVLVLVGCGGEKVERIRIVNNTGLEMARVTLGSAFSLAERATFTNVSPGAQTEYLIVTNFVYPCSVWTLDSTNYQRNTKLI